MTAAFSSTRPARRDPKRVQTIIWIALFAGVVALFGGSSRFDAVQAAALRPLVALFLIPAFYWISREKLGEARAPMAMLGLLMVWMAIQLIPLPPSIWQSLPGRDLVAELDALHGIEGNWRPISYVPMRGWNALISLVIPAASALLLLALRPSVRVVLLVIVALGVTDAVLGLAQLLSGPDSFLYFYTHTNAGGPVGLFANENHSGMFSALALVVIARLVCEKRTPRREVLLRIALAAGFVVILLAVLVSGSRAGLGLGLGALIASALIAWLSFKRPRMDGSGWLARISSRPWLVLATALLALAGLLYALLQFDRAPGVIDALNQDAFEDLRWRVWPVLTNMMGTYWLVGTGFGTFDAAYHIFEPDAFMGPAYLNQAHNDWAQLVIEGGLPAIILTLAMLRWIFVSVQRQFARDPAALARCVFWSAAIAIIAVASLVDYPLRTPLFQMVATWLVILLALDRREGPMQQ